MCKNMYKYLDGDIPRFDRLRRILGISISPAESDGKTPILGTMVDLDELRKECWLGISHKIRPLAWKLLSACDFEKNYIVKHFCLTSK